MIYLRINDRDLSVFANVAKDAGMAPMPFAQQEPQFAGSPAFTEGEQFTGDAVGNAERVFPLILSADSTADLHHLIREIESELARGADVEFSPDSADEVTHFDLERGRLEPDYEHWVGRADKLRCVLRLWTRPYGHTGTYRSVGSYLGTGPQFTLATGIFGDVPAEARLRIRHGKVFGGASTIVSMYAIKNPVPSGFTPFIGPSQLSGGSVVTATSLASGRLYGAYAAFDPGISAGNASAVIASAIPLRPQDAGRYRLLISDRSIIGAACPQKYQVELFAGPSAWVVATGGWATSIVPGFFTIRDLGEYTVASNLPSQYLRITWTGSAVVGGGASAIPHATAPLRVDGLLMVPVDQGAGLITNALGSGMLTEYDAANKTALIRTPSLVNLVDVGGALRGDYPRLPPTGSPMASGPVGIFAWAFCGVFGIGDTLPMDEVGVSIEVRERFRFLR